MIMYLVLLAASSLYALVTQDVGESCSEDQWKCDDGSCVSIDGEWNSIIRCQNSSHVKTLTSHRVTRQAQDGKCVLPEYPVNGTYTTHIPNARPGEAFDLVTINATCDQGFALIGSATPYCNKGWWSELMPKCVSQCHLPSHPSVKYRCLVFGQVEGSRDCEEYEINGTVVRPECRSPNYYSATALTYMRCIDTNWNYIAKCSPECGKVFSNDTRLVTGWAAAERAEVPWHAGIYTKATDPYKQICGGSLISNNIVLSAAQCFWNISESKQLPAADFAVAVGKLYRPWNDDNDKINVQKSNVSALHLPPVFQGSSANYQQDIAVVVVNTPFKFNGFVRPVCVDFDNFFQNTQLKVGNMGKLAGWGLTAVNGTPSQILKVTDLPVVSTETCIKESPLDLRGYITGDKICAGFKNEHEAVCKGNNGGGFTFPEWERGTPRFYLRGIVSTAPTSNDQCNPDVYTTFTQVLRHEHFIKQFWENGEPCQLEPHPSVEYSCFFSPNDQSYRPCNEYELAGTVVSPRCRSPGYYSVTDLNMMICVDGKWNYIPKCSQELPCKEESLTSNLRHTPHFSMDNETLKHVTVKRDSAGLLTYFEMHIAVQADEYVQIRLWDKVKIPNIGYFIAVGVGSNQSTFIDIQETTVQHTDTPDILSSTEIRTFRIQIDGGKLEFGKQGDKEPIVSHHNARARTLRYIKFFYGGRNRAKIFYDCPRDTELPCKVETLSSYQYSPFFSMDNETLKHVTVKRDSVGLLTSFEMQVAIQADEYVQIVLWDKKDNPNTKYFISVGWGGNQHTYFDYQERTTVQHTDTPDILTSTQFRTFYTKVDNGTLQFGKDGDSRPLILHHDARLRSVNYFEFQYGGDNNAKIRYDCPYVPELRCKEVFIGNFHLSPFYAMDNETLNHVTVKRDSAGLLTYFEMYIAILTDGDVLFSLWDEINNPQNYYSIFAGSNNYPYTTLRYRETEVQNIPHPDILPSAEFGSFYIKIDDGTLQFGKEADSSPLISYEDVRVRSLKYFRFGTDLGRSMKVHFDCPPPELGQS